MRLLVRVKAAVSRNVALPYCFDMNVNMHNNAVMLNSSTGDELFSATPAGAGGVSFASGRTTTSSPQLGVRQPEQR